MPADNNLAVAGVAAWIQTVKKEYPQLFPFLEVPEVGPLVLKLAAGKITPSLFQIKLRQTRWYRTHSDSQRQWLMTSYMDPASAKQQVNQRLQRVRQLSGQLGVQFNKPGRMRKIAEMSLRFNWNEDQMLQWILKSATANQEGKAELGGLGATMNTLRVAANQFMIPMGRNQLFRDAKKIVGGQATEETIAQKYRQLAIDRWQGNQTLVDVIKQGGNAAAFFEPYRQMLAEELEISPDGIDFMRDNRFTPITSNVRPDGSVGPMSLTEAQKHIRSLNEWGNTRRGVAEGDAIVNTLTKIFGARR